MPGPMERAQGAGERLKHVIAEYKHRTQTVTCVCGWQGSNASEAFRASAWNDHLVANRPKRT